MKFQTRQIKGKGRGKFLGFPTINMEIPAGLRFPEGIYAVKVTISNHTYIGAMHFGPIPTFAENQKSLEVFLLDTDGRELKSLDTNSIQIMLIKHIRDVQTFSSSKALTAQMQLDVEEVRKIAST